MLVQEQPIAADINELGEKLLEGGRGAEALDFLELAVKQNPNNGRYANNLAIARFQSGDLNGAIEALEAALRLGGDLRLFVLNFADLARTRPRLLRRGLEVCHAYLEQCGEDPDVLAAADLIAQEAAAADQEFQAAVTTMPEHAKLKVNGAAEAAHLVEMGQNIANQILDSLDGIAEARTILDFGVGLGRVLWPLSQKLPAAHFIGFDVDPMMLTSLEGVSAVADTQLVYTTADIPDNSVDAAYVISVFTHLDHTAEYWLWELSRVLAPGGRALVTYHDKTLFDEKCQQLGVNLTFTGHTTLGEGAEGSTGLGTYYETEAWERMVGQFFKIVRTEPRGLVGHQSFSVLEKGEGLVDSLALHRTYVRDLESELYEMRKAADLKI
ncbi:MAG: methyltransferase domain-containing protein [Candidatus Krumholzibacteria bacterium]|nr:methyltransferase domain-containing protein [Candidatus Krumholzibacteria bacterium]